MSNQSKNKPKIAIYWCASCGGCEISFVNTHEFLLEVDKHFELFFSPCLVDTKRGDVEALLDRDILITFINGAIRTEENLEMAELLRKKSVYIAAFGSCAQSGGIPSLANQRGNAALIAVAGERNCKEGNIPNLLDKVYSLHQKIEVDFTIPGCPPEPEQIVNLIKSLCYDNKIPVKNELLGCTLRSLCDECGREKRGIQPEKLVRNFEKIPEAELCLAEQGFLCLGSSTRGGCKALCPAANIPCTGCYGSLDFDSDPAAASLAGLSSVLKRCESEALLDDEIEKKIDDSIAAVADTVGTFYRYSLSESYLGDRVKS